MELVTHHSQATSYRGPFAAQVLELGTPYVSGMAGFSERSCSGGVLLWSTPTPQNGQPVREAEVQVTITNMPLQDFKAEAFVIDDRRFPLVRPYLYLLLSQMVRSNGLNWET